MFREISSMFLIVGCGLIHARGERPSEKFSLARIRGKMMARHKRWMGAALALSFVIAPFLNPPGAAAQSQSNSPAKQNSDPWTAAQTIEPAALAKELAYANSAAKPVIVCVGFHALYEGAHIPSAVFHGPAQTPQGVANLKKWAEAPPRSSNIVLYCGCCPFTRCPNIRPAFNVLRDMGFHHVRVLLIATDFHTDWTQAGYPTEKTVN
jgi:thiosulfate/3-mercaptopyruvate sulfurtransferase